MLEKATGARTAAILAKHGGSTLCTVDVAGRFGRDLSAKGEDEMMAFALDWLAGLYGSDIKRAVGRRHATRWNHEPWALGAMSVAAPGAQAARRCDDGGGAEPHLVRGRGGARAAVGHRRRRLGIGRAGGGCRAAHGRLAAAAAAARAQAAEAAAKKPASSKAQRMKSKALIAWSSGKDSAWALHEVRRDGEFDVVGALTTVTETFGRVSMHGVREELLAAQLEAAGLEPIRVPIPYPCPNEIYEARMAAALAEAKVAGVTHVIFGDLFLEDVRRYREEKLAGTGITPVFPMWGRPTAALAREMIGAGVEAYLDLRRSQAAAHRICWAKIGSRAARRIACEGRSLRREGRVSYIRCGRPDAVAADRGDCWRSHGSRRLCVCRLETPVIPKPSLNRAAGDHWVPTFAGAAAETSRAARTRTP